MVLGLARCVAAAALLFAVTVGTSAVAQSSSALAETLFTEGRALYEEGRFEDACPKFRESDRLEPAPGTKLNLALCEESLGRLATAWALFGVVADQLPTDDPRHALAVEHRRALDPRLPHVTLRLPSSAPSGTQVQLGGIELPHASLGTPLPIDPGEHQLLVRAPGHADVKKAIVAVEGKASAVLLPIGPEVAPAVPPSTPTPPTPTTTERGSPSTDHATMEDGGQQPEHAWTGLQYGAVGVAGAGLVGWIAGGAFALSARSKNDRSKRLGCEHNRCPPDAKRARLDALDAADRATVFGIVGTVLVAGGAVLWIVGTPDEGARVGARVTPDGVQLAVSTTLF